MDVYSKIAVVSANMGGFELGVPNNEQSVPFDEYRFFDGNFSPRVNSMTPRLQARIVKMFMWQFAPDYNYYLWVDSSCALLHEDSVKWFRDKLGDADLAVFKHPHRNTIQEEADYITHRLSIKDPYITSRYGGELLDDMMAEINDPDLPLYATTAFMMRDTYDMRKLMKEWWYGTSRYHSIDQIWLPYALSNSPCKVNVIPDNFMKCKYLTPIRK